MFLSGQALQSFPLLHQRITDNNSNHREGCQVIKFCSKCECETTHYDRGICKPCVKADNTAWREANNTDIDKQYGASFAERRLANTERIDAFKKSPEQLALRAARWAYSAEATRITNQNRRAHIITNGGTLSKGLSAKLFKLQKGKCPCCKQPLGDTYHLDHVVPLAKGGNNTDDNIQLLRKTCNLQKSARDPLIFMQSRGFLL